MHQQTSESSPGCPKVIAAKGWTLMHQGKPVLEGATLKDFRGDNQRVVGGRPPHKPSSSGYVYLGVPGRDASREAYAGVVDCEWVENAPSPETSH